MKDHPRIRHTPRPLFSCGIFGNCTEGVLSPTAPPATSATPPPRPISPVQSLPPPTLPPQPPPPVTRREPLLATSSSSSSSSSSANQSFTQWRFPMPETPLLNHHPPENGQHLPAAAGVAVFYTDMAELFHLTELQFSSDSDSDRLDALQLLEHRLVPNATGNAGPTCPTVVIAGVVQFLCRPETARTAAKVLLALCLAEPNRRPAVEAGAVGAVLEALPSLIGSATERALAAAELLCTVAEGVAEFRAHALSVPLMVELVGKMSGRGVEYGLSVLAAICSGGPVSEGAVAAEVVGQAAIIALQGQCSVRARRKGLQLLGVLQDKWGLELANGA